MLIRPVESRDAPAIGEIRNYYILHSMATLSTQPIGEEENARYLAEHGGEYPMLVLEEQGSVLGYASLGPFRHYIGMAEDSVYIRHDRLRQGLGEKLLSALLDTQQAKKLRTIVSVITGTNTASIELHKKAGFTYSGTIGKASVKMGEVVDVVFYQWYPKEGSHAGGEL